METIALSARASLSKWSCEDVGDWLKEQGFSKYSELFSNEHCIDGPALLALSEDDLKQPPIKLTVLGDIKRLMSKINELRANDPDYVNSNGIDVINLIKSQQNSNRYPHSTTITTMSINHLTSSSPMQNNAIVQPRPVFTTQVSLGSKRLDPEPWKTLLSFVYVFAVFMVTAFVMVIVHDRVPDMQKYPPLPDIFLDNMPYVPWAFAATEYVGMTLALMWIGVLFFHKHRFILLRRMFSLLGTIFLLRCITMLITSLSVPGRHLNCVGKRYGDMWSRMQRTFEIWQGLGMTVQGVSSCGDYMFSGHTSILTILNFFITEYTPALEYYYLHLTSWVLNIFGVFFILAAHEHYSIDVFIAFYLTSRLFMYYHTLANNRSLMQQDAYRTRVWFPLFSFFESKCDGIVPNEYEWPFSHPERWLPGTWLPESWTRTRVKNSSPVKDKVE